jgi:hypothetical protein
LNTPVPLQKRRAKAPPPLSGKDLLKESHVQQTVVEFMELDGWRAFRTELTVQRERGRVVGERGQPDYLFLRYGRWPKDERSDFQAAINCSVMWIEFKRPGEKPRADQLAWHERERARGALVMVVGDSTGDWWGEFKEWYKTSGLQRR